MDAVLGNIDVKASLGDDLDEDADVDMADPAPKESTSGSGVAANGDTSRPNGVAGDVGAQPEQGKEGKKGKKEKRKRASETATHEAASKSHKAKAKTDRHGNATTVDIRLKKKKKEAREE